MRNNRSIWLMILGAAIFASAAFVTLRAAEQAGRAPARGQATAPTEPRRQPAAPAVSGPSSTRPGSGTAGANGTSQSQVASVDLSKNGAAAANNLPRIVYFDFDSFVVKDEYRNVVEANAKYLSSDRKRRLAVEGHTDERGGREYNLALGQKRAEAVLKSLTLLGVPANQLEAVSYGKERPANEGHDESAYAKNRRAELKVR